MCKIIEQDVEKAEQMEKHKLEKEIHILREKVKKVLLIAKNTKIKSNITRQEQIGRRKMYADTECVYLPADKGKVMVAMDKRGHENSYESKMEKVLLDLKAKKINKNERRTSGGLGCDRKG